MSSKVLVLRWSGSAYDSLGGLLELTAHELEAEGLEVILFPADGPDWPSRLGRLLAQDSFTFALTMSGIGVELMLDSRLVWEAAKVPLFNWNCDHPCYFPTRHLRRSPFLLHGYVFPDHARYNIHHLNPNGAAFAVHLGMPPRSLFADAPLPLASRNGRILLTKSGLDTNVTETNWRTYPAILCAILFSAAEELFARNTGDILPVLQNLSETHGLFLSGNNRLALLLINELDAYIRFRRANLLMRSVLRYPVDVYGTGWDHVYSAETSAVFHGALSWRDAVERLPRYIGCLSINPLIEESTHDRVFFALSAGVTPVTDANRFSRKQMRLLQPYTFDFGQDRSTADSIGQAIEALLADPATALARTEATRQALEPDFSLRRSARQIVHFAAMHVTNSPADV